MFGEFCRKNDNAEGDTSKVSHHRKKSDNKTGHQANFKTASTNKHSAQVTKQGDNSNLMKLNYPSKVEALKNRVDVSLAENLNNQNIFIHYYNLNV